MSPSGWQAVRGSARALDEPHEVDVRGVLHVLQTPRHGESARSRPTRRPARPPSRGASQQRVELPPPARARVLCHVIGARRRATLPSPSLFGPLLTTIMVTPARLSRALASPSSAALRTQQVSRGLHMSRVVRAAPAPTSAEQTAQYPSEGRFMTTDSRFQLVALEICSAGSGRWYCGRPCASGQEGGG